MGDEIEVSRADPWWLKMLYAVLAVTALALMTMVLKEVIERAEGDQGEIHHLPVFDAAWFVFLLGACVSVIAALVLVSAGVVRKDRRFTRFGFWVAGLVALALVVIVVEELASGPPAPDEDVPGHGARSSVGSSGSSGR